MVILEQKFIAKPYAKIYRWCFIAIAISSLFISPPVALLTGICLALIGNPYAALSKKLTSKILSWCIIGMGAGMNIFNVMEVGIEGFTYTLAGIFGTLLAGHCLCLALKTDRETSLLMTMGTAICGGSAIVALATTIRAKDSSISVALATVFLLNALALILFPWVGHALDLSQAQFGLWSALAIHDTSSVVGATIAYGPEANLVGTSVKLARALWIAPVSILLACMLRTKEQKLTKPPYFIFGFIAAAALVSFIPSLKEAGDVVASGAKLGLSLALFLIGAGLSKESLRTVGFKPLLFAVILWLVVGSATLLAIVSGNI